MARKYLIDGNWLICSEGTCMQRIQVNSQSTIYAHGKLVATMNDRMDNNFYCLKMVSAGALVGAIVGAVVAAGAILTGGVAIVGVVSAIGAGALVGSVSGKLLSLMPCICACLTKPSMWTMVKNTVMIQNQKALMPDAKLNCLLGGMVSIILPQIEVVLDALALSDCAYDESEPAPAGWTEATDILNELQIELNDPKSGFKARLFKNEDTYILAFAGTEPIYKDMMDTVTDIRQGIGLDDKEYGQYASAVSLSDKINDKAEEDGKKLIITGHSLGGGLATVAGAKTGADTYTFNAAGVHERTFKDHDLDPENTKHIQAYYSDKDPLNIAQNNRVILMALLASSRCKFLSFLGSGLLLNGALPQVSGQRIGLETDTSLMSGHSLIDSKLKEALLAEQKNTPDLEVYTEHE